IPRSKISFSITGSSAPLMPLQVVQAKPTIPKPSFSISASKPDSCKYISATLEPGANEVFTQGLRTKPNSLAFLATKPAATTLLGLEVLVQEVIAANNTAPSGIRPWDSCSNASAKPPLMPSDARSVVDTRACGVEGPAMVRTTDDKSNSRTRIPRSYS